MIQALQESDESHRRLLLVGIAQQLKEDPTAVATLLREAGPLDFAPWAQAALDALQAGTAEIVLRGHRREVSSVASAPMPRR